MNTNNSHDRRSEYKAFRNARLRCCDPANSRYADYGGRGIKFLFDSFQQFLAEIGPRPTPKHSLDRIQNDGHYAPGNVRWATAKEQAANRRPHPSGYVCNGGRAIITIYVRHSSTCPHKEDESYQDCSCCKHFRWTKGHQQYRESAKTRSWAVAEWKKARLESELNDTLPS